MMSKYRNRISEEDKVKAIKLYQSGISANKIGLEIGVSKTAILKLLNKNGIAERNTYKKYHSDESFFKIIDTEEKAYWLGFISADGCIGKRDKIVVISLKKSDEKHLEKFRNSLSSNYPITNGHSHSPNNRKGKKFLNCRIAISSEKLIKNLHELGIDPKKSETITVCKNVPENLLNHYWRGWIDGDGSIGINRISFCGNFSIVSAFLEYAKKHVNTKANVRKYSSIFEVEISGKNLSKNLAELLYKDSKIYLDRKYEKAKFLWEV